MFRLSTVGALLICCQTIGCECALLTLRRPDDVDEATDELYNSQINKLESIVQADLMESVCLSHHSFPILKAVSVV